MHHTPLYSSLKGTAFHCPTAVVVVAAAALEAQPYPEAGTLVAAGAPTAVEEVGA